MPIASSSPTPIPPIAPVDPAPGAVLHARILRKGWDVDTWLDDLLEGHPGVIDARDGDGNTALQVALETRWRTGVLALLLRGANPLLTNALGQDARAIWEAEGDDLDQPVRRALEQAELRAMAQTVEPLGRRGRTRL